MLRLAGSYRYILAECDQNGIPSSVQFKTSFPTGQQHWLRLIRISPLFPFEGTEEPELSSLDRSFLLFGGPVAPSLIPENFHQGGFLSLGLFNFVFHSTDQELVEAGRSFLNDVGRSWESWTLDGAEIKKVDYCGPLKTFPSRFGLRALPTGSRDRGFRATREQYLSEILRAAGRAAFLYPEALETFKSLHHTVCKILESSDLETVDKHNALMNVNAVLSRNSDQLFSGGSPILYSPPRPAHHSLLGVGTAVLGFDRMREFAASVFARARLLDRIRLMKLIPPEPRRLFEIKPGDSFWRREHLFDHFQRLNLEGLKEDQANAVRELLKWKVGQENPTSDPPPASSGTPLLTFFSGRDGFRHTNFSISAPWQVISNCNAVPWTPHTFTHEFSHVPIRDILGLLLPEGRDPKRFEALLRWIATGNEPTFLDQLRTYVAFGIYSLGEKPGENGGGKKKITPSAFGRRIRDHFQEANEVLTHAFDFLYFYRKDSDHFVRSLWASWATLPRIQSRIPEYLTRTLCALSAKHLRRPDPGVQALADLDRGLASCATEFKEFSLIAEALGELNSRPKHYEESLNLRLPLVTFVREVLYSSHIARLVNREPDPSGGEYGGYGLRHFRFPQRWVQNPLRFVEEYCRAETANPAIACWMMQLLAFDEAP